MDYWSEMIPELFVHNTGMKLKVLNWVVYLRLNFFFSQWLMDCSKNGIMRPHEQVVQVEFYQC